MYAYDPQVVVFLGDLIDEGNEADKDDYLDYVTRFCKVNALEWCWCYCILGNYEFFMNSDRIALKLKGYEHCHFSQLPLVQRSVKNGKKNR